VDSLTENYEQKERELEDVKKNLQQTISDKYVEIESLKNELTGQLDSKEGEIITAKNEMEEKNKEINAIKLKLTSLEDFIEESKGAPQVIEKIRDILSVKGFLSDQELDTIIKDMK